MDRRPVMTAAASRQIFSAQSGRHVWVANLIVNNNPKQRNSVRPDFAQPQVGPSLARMLPAWLRLAKMLVGFVSPKSTAHCRPHAEEHRSTTQAQALPQSTRAAMRLEA
jgi:hypothetical protein